jgi:ribosome-interacting GTPase 1
MNEAIPIGMQITNADIQALLAQNPLATEQLRRIIAERELAELRAELEERKNGSKAKEPSKVAEA